MKMRLRGASVLAMLPLVSVGLASKSETSSGCEYEPIFATSKSF
jgi:hypothetical protein